MIKKRHIIIIIGIYLMFQTSGNILRLTPSFFDNGSSIMEYNIINNVEIDEIKDIIYKNTNVEKDSIMGTIEGKKKLKIEFAYVDIEIIRELDNTIEQKYGSSIQLTHMASISPMNLSTNFIIIYLIVSIFFIIGFVVFIKGIRLCVKARKYKTTSINLNE